MKTEPHSTGKPPKEVILSGMLVPYAEDGAPVLLRVDGSAALYLPCFDDQALLAKTLRRAAVPYEKAKVITDSVEFLSSIPMKGPDGEPLHIIINPWFTPEGKIRFLQLLRD